MSSQPCLNPRLEPLLDTQILRPLIATELVPDVATLRPRYLRDRGEDGSLVLYEVETHRGLVERVTVRRAPIHRLASESERFREDGWVLDAERGLLLLRFPLDRELRDLDRLFDPRVIRRMLPPGWQALGRVRKRRSRVEVASYRPERRLILRWDLAFRGPRGDHRRVLFLHRTRDPVASRTMERLRAAHQGGVRVPRARVLGDDLWTEQEVPGRPARLDRPDHVAALGRQIGMLHGAEPPEGLRRFDARSQWEAARRTVEGLARLVPELGQRAAELLDACETPGSEELVFAHGDLHRDQALLHNGECSLIDFDRAVVASRLLDLTTLWAHEIAARRDVCRGQFEVGYWRELQPTLERPELRFYRATSLLRVAERPIRWFEPHAHQRVSAILDAAQRVLESSA